MKQIDEKTNVMRILDGKKIEMDRIYGTGENYLSVDGGVGEIKIDFFGLTS